MSFLTIGGFSPVQKPSYVFTMVPTLNLKPQSLDPTPLDPKPLNYNRWTVKSQNPKRLDKP